MNMRLMGRFFYLHTQKHTQEYLLDFKSSGINTTAGCLQDRGQSCLATLAWAQRHPPLSISDNRHPTVPPPPNNPFGSHPATFTPCFARTMTKFLKHSTHWFFGSHVGSSEYVVHGYYRV